MIAIAEEDKSGWRSMSADDRLSILAKASQKIKESRGDLIGIMSAATGKTFMEGDVEVSEAIDFIEYYPRTAKTFLELENLEAKGKGVVLVIPPWNFPLAIPVGGVAAGLAAGNTVIIKPATAAAPVAFHFVQLMHKAGVPKEALQVVLPADRSSLNVLTSHPVIKHIIFTGGTETAYRILDNNPKVALSAETGGKNAIIVTSSADKDIAIASAVQSAFGNAGQKCSACSLLLLQKDLYDDAKFIAKLKDATESLIVGSPWNLRSEIGPMIDADTANKKLMHAIDKLEKGEEWLLQPEALDTRRCLMKPGIKIGVKKENYIFNTELFAPLLAVVRFKTLEEAIAMVNSTGYGLTSGLHSLDEREQLFWRDKIEAGNLYINRGITGAIVQRQSFGGMKASAFGSGIKTGGPNYVSCFMTIDEVEKRESSADISAMNLSKPLRTLIKSQKNAKAIIAAIEDYRKSYDTIFSQINDVSGIIGEDNQFRYIPAMGLALRVRCKDDLGKILMVAAAVEIVGASIDVSISPEFKDKAVLKSLFSTSRIENKESFNQRAPTFKRLRLCGGQTSEDYYTYAAAKGVCIADKAPLQCGRLELLNYLQEQSITTVYHRYGNLGDREM
jgi:RHH-type proline utilization regulon transcriptional repressor/proline dehydrogenase/delta 1-pyrroline-5-carboxylate dehydrogenase